MDLRGFFSLVGSGGRGQQKVEHCVVKEAAGQVSSHFEKKSPGSAVLYVPLKHRRKLINFRRDFDRFYRFFYTPLNLIYVFNAIEKVYTVARKSENYK